MFPEMIKWLFIVAAVVGILWYVWWDMIDDSDAPPKSLSDDLPGTAPRLHNPFFYLTTLFMNGRAMIGVALVLGFLVVKEMPPSVRNFIYAHTGWLEPYGEKFNDNMEAGNRPALSPLHITP